MPDFLRPHLIQKIKEQVREKERILKVDGFIFLDNPINDGKKVINRLNKFNLYPKEEVLPLSWYITNGESLIKIYKEIKENKFYVYKIINGRSHKMRIKNKY
jgi:hypothetical protein